MKITLKDGSVKEYAESKSVYEIALDISEGLARAACAGEVNGEVVDLRTVVSEDCELNILTANDEKGLAALRHTASHVLAEAVKRLYPEAKLAIGPSIDTGYYYDFEHAPFSNEDLETIEKEMKKIIKEGAKIERFELPRAEAIALMEEKGEPYKVELINDLPEDSVISFYRQGEFVDLCAGPHLMSTKGVKAFKLISSSGAYWRGNENNKMLTRIYGTAYSKKDELKAHMEHLEDIKKRDHNKLGREMELFTTVDVIGQGLPLLMPKGAAMVQTMQRWIEDEEERRGYMRTKTPLMAKKDLYVISDEIYAELTYGGKRHCSIGSLPGMKERTIVINGFSKAFAMTGWRLGYACGPATVIEQMVKLHQFAIMCAPTNSQFAAVEALKNCDMEVEMMVEAYDQRRRFLLNAFKEMGLECFEPYGAFYVFPSIKKFGMTSEEFATRLLSEQKLAVVPGTAFGASGEGFVRISYAYSIENLKVGLERIQKFIESLGGNDGRI